MKKTITILSLVLAFFATAALSVSAAEKKAAAKPSAKLLEKYDKNKDGKVNKADNLSKEEMKTYKEELKKESEGK